MTEEMRVINGVEVSVSTIKSALEKAGIKLEKKVNWRNLPCGTVVECKYYDDMLRAFIYYTPSEGKQLCMINLGYSGNPTKAEGLKCNFDNCKVIGKIKFSVEVE